MIIGYPYILTVSTEVLDDRTFDRNLLNQLAPLYRRLRQEKIPLHASEVMVDLRQVRRIFPYGALGVLVLLEGLVTIFGQRVRLQLPSVTEAEECVTWMAESGFLEAVGNWADVDPVPFGGLLPVRGDAYIIPVRIIEAHKHLLDLVDELLEKIPFLLGRTLSSEACVRVITILSELCQNVLYYASHGDNVRGYAMLQAFKGIVKFAVADTGAGIPETLKPKYQGEIVPWDDSAAIALAMRPGVTTRSSGGGLGLHRVTEVVRRYKGILNIRAGQGKVLLCRGSEYTYQARGIYRGPMYFWGTQIGIVLERL